MDTEHDRLATATAHAQTLAREANRSVTLNLVVPRWMADGMTAAAAKTARSRSQWMRDQILRGLEESAAQKGVFHAD